MVFYNIVTRELAPQFRGVKKQLFHGREADGNNSRVERKRCG